MQGKTSPPDFSTVREMFPSLKMKYKGMPVIYLDNPAGSQVPQMVIDAYRQYWSMSNAYGDGMFLTSRRTREIWEQARIGMANLLGAASADEIVFGPNMTSLTFQLSRSIKKLIRAGDEVIVTLLDHDANIAPWESLRESGAVIRYADIHIPECTLNLENLLSKIQPKTKLVAVTLAANATGTINDLSPIIARAHEVGAWVFVDAVQYVPHAPLDVQSLQCDFLVCSAYKFFGPHVGVLYGRQELLDQLPAENVSPAQKDPPYKFETGAKNSEGLAALVAVVKYLETLGRRFGETYAVEIAGGSFQRRQLIAAMMAIRQFEKKLTVRMIEGLQQIDGLRIWGITDLNRIHERVPTVCFTWPRMSPDQTAAHLAENGVFAWSGNYYAPALMQRLGLEGTGGAVRLGAVHYNTIDEIDHTVNLLKRAPDSRVI
ncbi:cysteine desulfurase-like protein [bacterium]|nr:cysteine desulfurase-like protein [bacterium]